MGVFDDINISEKKRFDTLTFFDREIDLRIEFTSSEINLLTAALEKIDSMSEKSRKDPNERSILAYEKAVGGAIDIIVRTEEDRAYMKDAIINVDPDSGRFLSSGEFVLIIRACLKADRERLAEETKKAEAGENIS